MSSALRFSTIAAAAILAAPLAAQQPPQHAPAKPTLTSADYAKWETLGAGALSPDGKWLAFDLRRGNGSTELHYRAVGTDKETTARSATNPQFTGNSRWLLYTITPDTAGGRGGRGRAGGGGGRGGRGGGEPAAEGGTAPNRNKVGVVDLRTGTLTTLDDIQSYTLSSDGSHVALRRYPAAGRRAADVIVRDLDAGTELAFGNVSESAWNDDGSMLAMTIDVDGHTGNGVQVLETKTGVVRSLDASDALYTGLTWRSHSADLVALRSKTDSAFRRHGLRRSGLARRRRLRRETDI